MSIQTEIDRIKTGIASAYAALAEKGITSTGGVDELGELIRSIEGRNAKVFTFTPASDTTTFSIENPYGITDKCFVFLFSTNKNQKQREIFILDNMFKKIEALLLEDDINKTKQAIQTDIAEIIELFEGGLNRVLLSTELEIIRLWFEKGMYPVERIKEVIRDNQRSLSVKKVDKVLSQNIVLTDKIDEEKAEALKRIFKSI